MTSSGLERERNIQGVYQVIGVDDTYSSFLKLGRTAKSQKLTEAQRFCLV